MATVFVVCAVLLQVCPIVVWRARSLHRLQHAELLIRTVSGWLVGTLLFVTLALRAA